MTAPKIIKKMDIGGRMGSWYRRQSDGKFIQYKSFRYEKGAHRQRNYVTDKETMRRQENTIDDLRAEAAQLQEEKAALVSGRTTDKETIQSQAKALEKLRAEISDLKATICKLQRCDPRAEQREPTADAKLKNVEDQGGAFLL